MLLRSISHAFEPGQLIGLVGPNGAGKSTLIKVLCQLVRPSSGTITLNGNRLSLISKKQLSKDISYLPQGHDVYGALSVDTVVSLGRLPHLKPLSQILEADRIAIDRACDQAQVDHLRHRSFDTLSGGEKARVMLARALTSEAPILLADEPVTGLDPYHQLHVMEILAQRANNGDAVVCVLHDLTLAERFCTEVCLLKEGQFVASGAPSDVFTPENLSAAFSINVHRGQYQDESFVIPWSRAHPATAQSEPLHGGN